MPHNENDIPRGNAAGFLKYWKHDALSGFLVFLIALPLCLGISLASGYPPLAGVFTAIVGALLTTFLSDSELTIKGPAAGLIVIAIGCINDFGGDGVAGGLSAADLHAYRAALAIGVAAAVLQILFGLFRAGILGEFFPVSAVHGMLAAIGVVIIAKQFPVALGVSAQGPPLELLGKIPQIVSECNPAIAAIGVTSLLIMFCWPLIRHRLSFLKILPAPMIVVLVAIPMGWAFDLLHAHSYVLQGHKYQLGEQYLVAMPDHMFGMFEEVTFPDFSALAVPKAWKWVMMFFIIGSLESVLSAKAIDIIDPWKRKSSMDRDMLAVGAANLCCACVGGLPMISEIVRSRANIDYGARTRFANFWHGVFLLVCVALIPTVLHLIPLAALAAMLVYTGYRLAHPSEFVHVYHIGREQLVVFLATIIGVLATDLLIGIAIGIVTKMILHVANGVPLRALFKTYLEVEQRDDNTCVIRARESAVFSNWIPFRRQIEDLGLLQRQNIIVDVSETRLIDHTVMDKLRQMERLFAEEGLRFDIVGLENHVPLARHEHSARKFGMVQMQRVVIIADQSLEARLVRAFADIGATGFTTIPCRGAGRRLLSGGEFATRPQIRLEVIVPPAVGEELVAFLRREILPDYHITASVEAIEVVRAEQFYPLPARNSARVAAGDGDKLLTSAK